MAHPRAPGNCFSLGEGILCHQPGNNKAMGGKVCDTGRVCSLASHRLAEAAVKVRCSSQG